MAPMKKKTCKRNEKTEQTTNKLVITHQTVLIKFKTKAFVTQNTRLIRLAIRVNRTYNRTNRGLIRVTLGPFQCIRESRV